METILESVWMQNQNQDLYKLGKDGEISSQGSQCR